MSVKHRFSRLGLLCLFLMTLSKSWGQEKVSSDSVLNLPTNRYLTLGLGSTSIRLKDDHMSPLNYYGGTINLNLGAYKRKKQSIRTFSLGATYTNTQPRSDSREIDPRSKYFRLDLSYAQQHYVRSFWKDQLRWYVGGKIRSHSNIRINPQLDGGMITFLFANGLFASSVLEREVRVSSRPLTIGWQLDLPVINHVIRPSYLNIYDFVNPQNDWLEERLEDSKWRGIGSYTNLTSTIYLLYPISSSNVLRFGYEWDFYQVDGVLSATSATNTFLFSLLFHF